MEATRCERLELPEVRRRSRPLGRFLPRDGRPVASYPRYAAALGHAAVLPSLPQHLLMPTARERAADLKYAAIAKRHGMRNSLRIMWEARRAGISPSLACALMTKETGDATTVKGGGNNVFGHDPTIYAGAGKVTKAKYLAYKRQRGRTHMQGVGPGQLTFWTVQDAADNLGGCWVPKYNIRIAFGLLAGQIKAHGKRDGIRRYNGTGPAAEAYANSVLRMEKVWHKRLHGR